MSEADERGVDWEKDYAVNIPLGTHIKVYWTGERRWFVGVIDNARKEDGKRIHHVTYRDGDKKWHHLPSEWWLKVKDTVKEKAEKTAAKAAVVLLSPSPRRGRQAASITPFARRWVST